jgi:Ribbon-helix-helix protein, copG family
MAKKSITVIPKSTAKKKRGPGRPATGKDPLVALRLPPELTDEVEAWAARNDIFSRSAAIRELIARGLKK